jgi:hypothetical protein
MRGFTEPPKDDDIYDIQSYGVDWEDFDDLQILTHYN